MEFVNLNGTMMESDEAGIPVDDHSYRYGEGLFETIKVEQGVIRLADLHFTRLFDGLALLNFRIPETFARRSLEQQIIELCKRNQCQELARVRLSVSTGRGGLYDNGEDLRYLIECWALQKTVNELNKTGLAIGVFDQARKSCDVFSNQKSASHLPYAVAARFARNGQLDDCLLLNTHGRVCDSTIANVFWVSGQAIFTPPLSEGCIAGVMRRNLIEKLGNEFSISERPSNISDLESADEIFLTNAIRGIRWVGTFRGRSFGNSMAQRVFTRLFDQINNESPG